MSQFVHLHVHTQYSILDGASNIKNLIKKAAEYNMPAVTMTDHGNLFGVKDFLNSVKAHNDEEQKLQKKAEEKGEIYKARVLKPIIGCEMYVARRSLNLKEKDVKEDRSGNHLIVIAKNETGYRNLIKLSSVAFTEGFYSKPRIDKELLFKHKEGLIISTACIAGEIPRAIRSGDIELAENLVKEYQSEFGEDFYLELQRHKATDPNADSEVYPQQQLVNKHLVELSAKTGVKVIATNDVHFINSEDAEAHDRLICINTGSQLDDVSRMHYTKQEWFKSPEEMAIIFEDHPEAIANTIEISNKIEPFNLNKAPVMPKFPIPEEFGTIEKYKETFSEEDLISEFTNETFIRLGGYNNVLRIKFEADYLQHLVEIGAKNRYGENPSDEVNQRISFELQTLKNMGFPGYFLIVQDFISQARKMGIWVGPGRGSAAGSVVSYCLQVTDIDPFKYDLLFERFLNPERISMPDIDIDFDEDGRENILKWVVDKYGKDKVANIITFGKMAAKSSIKDVARVQKLSLSEAERLTKMIPEKPDMDLVKAFKESPELRKEKESGTPEVMSTLKYAQTLEGSVRQTGIHACGIIISRNPLTEYIPVCISKDSDLLVTQFDGHYLEEVGMLKMDFLGLKTLSILKDAVTNVELSKGIVVDINKISLEDKKTFELFSKGLTTAVFQFESENMQKYLRELKPNRFEDLIAMNALYRPGPMEYIPNFISRKHGREAIHYDLPDMEGILKDTYGVTVYQEQVMLLSQKLAGFTKGDADGLRKAMGKKQRAVLDKMKGSFMEGCKKNGHAEVTCEKIWTDWEAFAQYAFNKSHSTCYAYLAYQTAYLKAHYPAEFLAANLSRNLDDIKEITKLMDACRRMNLKVLGPDVNESHIKFTVNKDGNLRFGLGAIKGLGESAAEVIIKERNANGNFTDIFNFVERVSPSTVNKRNLEALAMSGGFDSFTELKRYQYFGDGEISFIEQLIRYGSKFQSDKNNTQQSLFGNINPIEIKRPEIPKNEEWSRLFQLEKEKELIGIYLSAHPLDPYRYDIESLTSNSLSEIHDLSSFEGKEITIAGFVTSTQNKMSKTGNPFSSSTIEDFSDTFRFSLFGKDFVEYGKYMQVGMCLLIKANVKRRMRDDNQGELELKFSKISLLSESRKEIKKVILKIPVHNINEEFISEIEKLCKKHKGKSQLNFSIYSDNDRLSIDMFTRNFAITLNNDLIDYFTDNGLEFKSN
ncbi:MAG: DNA polymerase III subunit alpha [Bacteroidia bacterium]|nr:DNA polymerase III subunit alpha [Bacteroidia bacterium]